MLVRMLGELPGCCCWYEPNTLWRAGHAYRGHDVAGAEDARPWVRRWVRRNFLRYQRDHGGRRVIEKSPYNVVRLPFIHAIFPESKIVHIHRDGRANLRSQVEKFETFMAYKGAPSGHIYNRLCQTPPWEWPAYLPRTFSGAWRAYVMGKPIRWFGLRYPGWRDDSRSLVKAQVAAKQWVVAVETALHDLESLPADAWLSLTYEDLVADPELWFRRIIDFCGLEADDRFWSLVRAKVHKRSVTRWQDELDPQVLDEAMPIMGGLLKRLGYVDD